jgi:F-type H+-transporting ATPase subunit gamma
MGNLKEVRNRIASVTSTRQITSAMKLVSASKLKRAQDNIIKMRPYANKLKEILGNLSQSSESMAESPFARKGEGGKILLVVVSSNKGLCGAFNANVIKLANSTLQSHQQHGKTSIDVMCIGRKAQSFFAKRNVNVVATFDAVVDKPTYGAANEIAEQIMNDFAAGKYDKVEIIYNEFKSAATQNVVCEQFLPIQPNTSGAVKKSNTDYIFQPSKAEIIFNLIPTSLKTQFFKVILDSQAAEHGARMTAMHKATDNAGELLKDLKLSYNKARQAAITGEILEIVAGAEALK